MKVLILALQIKTITLLSIIETSVANKSFNVNLQPMVNAGDKRIFGAELY